MKKISIIINVFKIAILTLSFCICIVFLSACVNPWLDNAMSQHGVEWRVEENDCGVALRFVNLRKEDCYYYNYGYIEYKNKHIEIAMEWWSNRFRICQVSYYGEDISNYDKSDEADYDSVVSRYITGNCDIEKKKKIKLSISEDCLFDGELDGIDIIVSPHEVNPIDYGVELHNNVEWGNSEENIFIETRPEMKNFSVGTYNEKKIVTYWLDKDRFSMYELVDNVQQDIELACGWYDYTGDSVTLNFEKNNITNQDIIVLIGKTSTKAFYSPYEWYPTVEDGVTV